MDCWQGVQVARDVSRYWQWVQLSSFYYYYYYWSMGCLGSGSEHSEKGRFSLHTHIHTWTHTHSTHTFMLFNELLEFWDHYKSQWKSFAPSFTSDLLSIPATLIFFWTLRSFFILPSIDSVMCYGPSFFNWQLEDSSSVWEKPHKIRHVTEEWCSLGRVNGLLLAKIRLLCRKRNK